MSKVENQTAAATILGVDPEIVKRCRRLNSAGCLPGGRYDIAKLRKWIAENESALKVEGEKLSLREQKLNEEIRKLRIANDEKEGLVVRIAWVAERDASLAERARPIIYGKMVDEAAADMTNDVAINRAILLRIADRVFLEISELPKEWKQLQPEITGSPS